MAPTTGRQALAARSAALQTAPVEKLLSQLAFGLDWTRPPRQQNGTSFYYFDADQWRYDDLNAEKFSELAAERLIQHPESKVPRPLGWVVGEQTFGKSAAPYTLYRTNN